MKPASLRGMPYTSRPPNFPCVASIASFQRRITTFTSNVRRLSSKRSKLYCAKCGQSNATSAASGGLLLAEDVIPREDREAELTIQTWQHERVLRVALDLRRGTCGHHDVVHETAYLSAR